MAIALRSGLPFNIILQNYRRMHELEWEKYLVLLSLCPIFDNNGKFAFVIGFHYDITPMFDPNSRSRCSTPGRGAVGSRLQTPDLWMNDNTANPGGSPLLSGRESPGSLPSFSSRPTSPEALNSMAPNSPIASNIRQESHPESPMAATNRLEVSDASLDVSPIKNIQFDTSMTTMDMSALHYLPSLNSTGRSLPLDAQPDVTNPGYVLKAIFLVEMLSKIMPRIMPIPAVAQVHELLNAINKEKKENLSYSQG
jgi:hypothetical protein